MSDKVSNVKFPLLVLFRTMHISRSIKHHISFGAVLVATLNVPNIIVISMGGTSLCYHPYLIHA